MKVSRRKGENVKYSFTLHQLQGHPELVSGSPLAELLGDAEINSAWQLLGCAQAYLMDNIINTFSVQGFDNAVSGGAWGSQNSGPALAWIKKALQISKGGVPTAFVGMPIVENNLDTLQNPTMWIIIFGTPLHDLQAFLRARGRIVLTCFFCNFFYAKKS